MTAEEYRTEMARRAADHARTAESFLVTVRMGLGMSDDARSSASAAHAALALYYQAESKK